MRTKSSSQTAATRPVFLRSLQELRLFTSGKKRGQALLLQPLRHRLLMARSGVQRVPAFLIDAGVDDWRSRPPTIVASTHMLRPLGPIRWFRFRHRCPKLLSE